MRWMVRICVMLFALYCGFKATPEETVGSGDRTSSTVRYVALGDSIAYGYGLQNREEQSYVGLVRKYLEKEYDYVISSNFGTNGMRSGQLLDILTNPENENYSKYHATLQYADVVTVSIGSNDLLHLVKLDLNMKSLIENGGKLFQKACQEFQENFPRIIKEIRKINPQAEIYADNIYNPTKGLSAYGSIYDVAEHYISLMNQCFFDSKEYRVVDIKAGFDKEKKSMINVSWKGNEIDPHPSAEGHERIAELVIKEMEQNRSGGSASYPSQDKK